MSRVASSSATGINPSIGVINTPAPTSATQAGATNPSGNIESLLVDSNGALIVNTSGSFEVQNLNVLYNEVSAVAVGIETTINTYTAPVGKTCYLLNILGAGQNIGQFNIYSGVPLFDKQYLSYTLFNVTFDYKTGVNSVPGYVVASGSTIKVTAINAGSSSCMYNSRIMVLEVG